MGGSEYQATIKKLLDSHYSDVRLEWRMTSAASDAFISDVRRYAPRVDVAVGPFNTTQGGDSDIDKQLINHKLLEKLQDKQANPNPRCLLAIEVTFSGSSKHILGDILNASALGYYGIVIGKPEMMPKIQRNIEYIRQLAELNKLPILFQNVLVVSTDEFIELVS